MSKTTGNPSPRRRQHSADFKTKVVVAVLRGDRTQAQLASEFSVHPVQIASWKKQALEGLPGIFGAQALRTQQEREATEQHLYEVIGRLQTELVWLKKSLALPLDVRREMVAPVEGLSIRRQCELLSLNRSGIYYQPTPASQYELILRAAIDQVFTERPEYGVRRMVVALRELGASIIGASIICVGKTPGIRIEVQIAKVEVDGVSEPFSASESTSHAFDLLDLSVC